MKTAEQLRERYAKLWQRYCNLEDEYSPPRSEPGTVVHELTNGTLGIVSPS